MRLPLIFCCLAALLGQAWAQPTPNEALRCDPPLDALDRDQYLRALSLDLRGELPSAEDLAAVADADDVPAALIDDWLASDAFAAQAVRRHRALLWNNVENTTLLGASSSLQRATGDEFAGAPSVYYRRNRAQTYRGAVAPCLNEPARFDADGNVISRMVDGVRREGFVEVAPYWDPATPIRLCGFDANPAEVTPDGVTCDSLAGLNDAECGCGPDLERCTLGAVHRAVNRAMGEAMDRLLHQLIVEDRPYTELFSTKRAFVNGPLVFFYRRQAKIGRFNFDPAPVNVDTLPDLGFTDEDTWVEITLPPAHAGLLTRAAYLLRFQTNRSRANRFYDAFLCAPFQPPAGGLPVADEAAQRTPDLQERAGCKYCHALLEPSAAHWGRWMENGAGYLEPAQFPPAREDCLSCARTGRNCSAECRNFYVTNTLSPVEEEYVGMLNAYYFRRDDHVRNVETGPRLLANTAVADGRLTQCVSQRTAEWLLGRTLDHAGDDAWVGELARSFAAQGYSYRALVRQIVTDPRYRRVR